MAGVSFHRLAEIELNEAAQYYERSSTGLGKAFLDEVDHSIRLILEHPEAGSVLLGRVRRRIVRKFPYAVLYSIRPDVIRILAIMNSKRRPMYWIDRE